MGTWNFSEFLRIFPKGLNPLKFWGKIQSGVCSKYYNLNSCGIMKPAPRDFGRHRHRVPWPERPPLFHFGAESRAKLCLANVARRELYPLSISFDFSLNQIQVPTT
jgi:hypothetical protein